MANILLDKVVAITGASSGIGRATAIACASQGARLLLHHLDTPEASRDAESVLEELRTVSPDSKHHLFAADITKDGTATELVQESVSKHGRLDSLVNNAGICTFSPYQDVSRSLLERHMSVNFTAAYLLTQAAAKQMAKQSQGGSIVNIASITALLGSAQLTHYSPTKAAILGMSVSYGVAFGQKGIRINSVCPGTIETTMNKADLDQGTKRVEMAARYHCVG